MDGVSRRSRPELYGAKGTQVEQRALSTLSLRAEEGPRNMQLKQPLRVPRHTGIHTKYLYV